MLTLADLNARQGDIDVEVDLSQSQGISLDDLPFNRRIETKRFLDASRWFPIQDAYVLDIESYRLNSKVRSIQLYDISAKKVHFFVHGIVDEEVRERIKEELKNYGIEVAFHLYSTEEDLIVQFFEFLRENPKHLIGHNIAHFDLGLLNMKRQKYIFGRDKVKVMWLSEVMWEDHILKSSIGEQPPSLDPLEGHGLNVE